MSSFLWPLIRFNSRPPKTSNSVDSDAFRVILPHCKTGHFIWLYAFTSTCSTHQMLSLSICSRPQGESALLLSQRWRDGRWWTTCALLGVWCALCPVTSTTSPWTRHGERGAISFGSLFFLFFFGDDSICSYPSTPGLSTIETSVLQPRSRSVTAELYFKFFRFH